MFSLFLRFSDLRLIINENLASYFRVFNKLLLVLYVHKWQCFIFASINIRNQKLTNRKKKINSMQLKPERVEIIKPVLIVFAVLITLIVMVATKWVKIDNIWFIFPLFEIRISTVVTAIACFALVLSLQRRNTLKSVYYASLAVIFSMGLYEIVWYYTAAAFRGWDLRIFQFAALFGWVLLGIREVFRKRPSKLSRVLYGVFVISILIWIGMGFQFNYVGNSSFSISGEILNVVSKAALFIAFALHIGSVKS